MNEVLPNRLVGRETEKWDKEKRIGIVLEKQYLVIKTLQLYVLFIIIIIVIIIVIIAMNYHYCYCCAFFYHSIFVRALMSPFTVKSAKFIINPHLTKSSGKETKKGKGKYELLLIRVIVRVHTVTYDIGSVFLELLFSSDKLVDVEF